MLESCGIETAADINRHVILRVPGFGPASTQRLLDWLSIKEGANLILNRESTRDISPIWTGSSVSEKRDRKPHCKGAADLRHVRGTILARRQTLEGAMRQVVERLAQADVDLRVVQSSGLAQPRSAIRTDSSSEIGTITP